MEGEILTTPDTRKARRIYHVTNWKTYNKDLCKRYRLDVWLSNRVINNWYYKSINRKQGAPVIYSRTAILACCQLRLLFGLSLRATQGFLDSLFQKLGLALRCPHYSQLCRRAKELRSIKLPKSKSNNLLFALIDSTGLKVYGQGEWHVKMHKASRRRTWRKLSLIVDPVSQEIIDNSLTSSKTHDANALLKMLPKLPSTIEALWGDGAYDSTSVYRSLYEQQIRPIIPLQKGAILTGKNYRKQRYLGRRSLVQAMPEMVPRDAAVEYINSFPNKKEGRKCWKQHSLYHLRSLVETAIMRFKQTFSDKLKFRTFANQQAETRVKCYILNKMIQIASANSKTIEFLT